MSDFEGRIEALEAEVAGLDVKLTDTRRAVDRLSDYVIGPLRVDAVGGRDVDHSPLLQALKHQMSDAIEAASLPEGAQRKPTKGKKPGLHVKIGSWETILSTPVAISLGLLVFLILVVAPEVIVMILQGEGP